MPNSELSPLELSIFRALQHGPATAALICDAYRSPFAGDREIMAAIASLISNSYVIGSSDTPIRYSITASPASEFVKYLEERIKDWNDEIDALNAAGVVNKSYREHMNAFTTARDEDVDILRQFKRLNGMEI
jgi:hypothetical protein